MKERGREGEREEREEGEREGGRERGNRATCHGQYNMHVHVHMM